MIHNDTVIAVSIQMVSVQQLKTKLLFAKMKVSHSMFSPNENSDMTQFLVQYNAFPLDIAALTTVNLNHQHETFEEVLRCQAKFLTCYFVVCQ